MTISLALDHSSPELLPIAPAVWEGPQALSITIHDVAPATQRLCEIWADQLERVAPLKLTWLVVPFYKGRHSSASFERWLEARLHRGDELALHGLTHCDDGPPVRNAIDHIQRRWYTDSEGEFAALDQVPALHRLKLGRLWFSRRGWPVHGFVAPAWLMSRGTWAALTRQPFDYTCTRTSLFTMPRHTQSPAAIGNLPAQSVVYSTRAAWRRLLSKPWNRWVAHTQRQRPWTRFELHPADVEHPALRNSALSLIAQDVRGARRESLTLAAAANRIRISQSLS